MNLQSGLVAAAATLLLGGMALRSRTALVAAVVGLVILGFGYVLAPPAIMTTGAMPYSASQVAGFSVYPLGAAALVVAFLLAFPALQSAAGATATGGFAMAAGCGCCVVNGALNGLGHAAGLGTTGTTITILGMGTAAAGLWWMGSPRAAGIAAVGAVVAWGASGISGLFLDAPARAPLSVAVRFGGLLLITGVAFVLACRSARRADEKPAGTPVGLRKEAAGGALR